MWIIFFKKKYCFYFTSLTNIGRNVLWTSCRKTDWRSEFSRSVPASTKSISYLDAIILLSNFRGINIFWQIYGLGLAIICFILSPKISPNPKIFFLLGYQKLYWQPSHYILVNTSKKSFGGGEGRSQPQWKIVKNIWKKYSSFCENKSVFQKKISCLGKKNILLLFYKVKVLMVLL